MPADTPQHDPTSYLVRVEELVSNNARDLVLVVPPEQREHARESGWWDGKWIATARNEGFAHLIADAWNARVVASAARPAPADSPDAPTITTGCPHPAEGLSRGPDTPLRHGTHQTEVCGACGAWRQRHHIETPWRGNWQAGPIPTERSDDY